MRGNSERLNTISDLGLNSKGGRMVRLAEKKDFCKKYEKILMNIKPYKPEWDFKTDEEAQKIVEQARLQIGYSVKTNDKDIFMSLFRVSRGIL